MGLTLFILLYAINKGEKELTKSILLFLRLSLLLFIRNINFKKHNDNIIKNFVCQSICNERYVECNERYVECNERYAMVFLDIFKSD